VSRHYDTMTVEQIRSLPIGDYAADDAICLMWITAPLLDRCGEILRAWGFRYKTLFQNWIKLNKDGTPFMGMGYYSRSNAEFLLLATRGKGLQRKCKGISQILEAPRREHSRKPDEIYERIEQLWDGPYCEIFARATPRLGWTFIGDQVGMFPEPDCEPLLKWVRISHGGRDYSVPLCLAEANNIPIIRHLPPKALPPARHQSISNSPNIQRPRPHGYTSRARMVGPVKFPAISPRRGGCGLCQGRKHQGRSPRRDPRVEKCQQRSHVCRRYASASYIAQATLWEQVEGGEPYPFRLSSSIRVAG
jgi:N6-adenosine-specific RNA methylase IME4